MEGRVERQPRGTPGYLGIPRVLDARFWNGGEGGRHAAVIVAVAGEVGDWAAYAGAADNWCEIDAVESVIASGSKISQHDAEALFPDLATRYVWRH